MNLEDIRKDINEIDEKIYELFNMRMKCTEKIAESKFENDDKIYKPSREKEIYEMYKDSPDYITLIRKIMQISRKKQYKIINELKVKKTNDILLMKEESIEDILTISVKADYMSQKGLDLKSILSIIADTSLEVVKINADGKNNTIYAEFKSPKDDKKLQEAYILKYMLEEETI